MTDFAHPETLVSTAWVAAHAADPGVVLVEVNVDTDLYADAGDQVKLCHVTGQVVDAENGKCRGFVMAVARSAAQGHLIHGDLIPPNQDDFTVGLWSVGGLLPPPPLQNRA